jgi:hypothetical protein
VIQRWPDIYRDHRGYILIGGSKIEVGGVRKWTDIPLQIASTSSRNASISFCSVRVIR